MNALANSQMNELAKFLAPSDGVPGVTFARYTGQEGKDERDAIKDNPPDILLTNFMMLKLLMTRQSELDRTFAFKLHQFLAGAGRAYTTRPVTF